MKKVLIALDYDPTAQKVAETGFSIAQSMNAEVILLHVISDPLYYSSGNYSPVMGFPGYITPDPSIPKSVDDLKKESLDYLDKSRLYLGDGNIQIMVAEGQFAETILKTAKDLNADIIVLGSHSRSWLEKIVMGSVAKEVLDHTSVPLFIVPTKKRD